MGKCVEIIDRGDDTVDLMGMSSKALRDLNQLLLDLHDEGRLDGDPNMSDLFSDVSESCMRCYK